MTVGMLNRSAVIITPLLPYLEWAKRDDDSGVAERVFETLRREPHVYLLPEYENPESERAVLEHFWPRLFAAMLGCWVLAPSAVGGVNVSPCKKDAYATFGTQQRSQALFGL